MKLKVPNKLRSAAAQCRAKAIGFSNAVVAKTVGPNGLFRGLPDLFRALPGLLWNLPALLKRAGMALLRWRPTERTWTLLAGLVAVALGGFLVMAPAKELATGRDFGLEVLLTLCWLATGSAMLAGGVGIFLRLPSYRRFLKLAFICSIPLPVAFGYRTFEMAVKMRTATESVREQLEPWVSGGVQLSLFFLAVTCFLVFLLRFRYLKSLACSGAILSSRAGPVISGALGAAVGSGLGYLVWLLFRWLGFSKGIQWFSDSLYMVPVDYFVAIGALLGATLFAYLAQRRRTSRAATQLRGP